MRTLTTVVLTGCTLMLIAGCNSHSMMDKSMGNEMTSMEKPNDTMDATSESMMKDDMAGEPMEKPMKKVME